MYMAQEVAGEAGKAQGLACLLVQVVPKELVNKARKSLGAAELLQVALKRNCLSSSYRQKEFKRRIHSTENCMSKSHVSAAARN